MSPNRHCLFSRRRVPIRLSPALLISWPSGVVVAAGHAKYCLVPCFGCGHAAPFDAWRLVASDLICFPGLPYFVALRSDSV